MDCMDTHLPRRTPWYITLYLFCRWIPMADVLNTCESWVDPGKVSTRSTIERTFGIWKKRFNLMHSEVLWQAIFIYVSIQKMRHFYGKGYNFEIYTILFSSNLIYIFENLVCQIQNSKESVCYSSTWDFILSLFSLRRFFKELYNNDKCR
jgi:hypothetical protein